MDGEIEERIQEFHIDFTCNAHWAGNSLTINCPTIPARDYVARTLEEKGIVIRVRN